MYGEVLIPPAIFKELAVDSQKPGTATLKTALSEGKLRVVEVQPSKDKSPLGLLLDPGEVEAILLAEQMNCRFLLMDERKGRLVAKKRGIPIVGICGLLLLAKEQGFIPLV
jgi:predicted nucleic acid-binding protein